LLCVTCASGGTPLCLRQAAVALPPPGGLRRRQHSVPTAGDQPPYHHSCLRLLTARRAGAGSVGFNTGRAWHRQARTVTLFCSTAAPLFPQLVQQHPAYASGRATAFVADAGRDALAAPGGPVPAGSVDYVTMVFMLSALPPEAMPQVQPWDGRGETRFRTAPCMLLCLVAAAPRAQSE
jgi:hypothetical protein